MTNQCAFRGWVSGPDAPIPTDPHSYSQVGESRPPTPCSRLVCNSCGHVVKARDGWCLDHTGLAPDLPFAEWLSGLYEASTWTSDPHVRPSPRIRAYLCRCTYRGVVEPMPIDQGENAFGGPQELAAWKCGGHPLRASHLPDSSVPAFPVAVLGHTYANVEELVVELLRRARGGVVEVPSDMGPSEPFTRELANPAVAMALEAASVAILREESDADAVMIAIDLGRGRLFYLELLARLRDPTLAERTRDGLSVRDSAFSALICDPAAREPALNASAAELMRAEKRFDRVFDLLARWDPNGAMIPTFDAAVAAGAASPSDVDLVVRSVLVERSAELPSAATIAGRRPELAARFREVLDTLTVPSELRIQTLAALARRG